MDANLESTSKNLQTTADKIENQIKKDLSEIISEMKRYTEAVNGYNEGLSKIKEPIQELVQKLPATQDILSIVDSNKNIISGIENVQKLIQEPNNPFTVTILEISNTLSKINGRLSTINISDNNLSPFEGPQLNKITNLVSTMIEMNKSLNDISANLERLGLYIERRANRAIVHKIQAFIAKVLDAIVNIIHIIKLKIRWLKIKKNH
jgi:chromosome segregation ATPase